MKDLMIGVVGAGVIGEAIIRALLQSGYTNDQIRIFEKRSERVSELKRLYGVTTGDLKSCDSYFLATKPQDLESITEILSDQTISNKLFVSLMAGIKIRGIQRYTGGTNRVMRVMTNTPILVGRGMSVISHGDNCTVEDIEWVRDLLCSSGEVLVLGEEYMDAVTSLSGSGPAYFLAFMEDLISGGIKLGLNAEVAEFLVKQTFLGTAKLLSIRTESVTSLRNEVTSPGGTTEAALKVFESSKLRNSIEKALEAARLRAAQLSSISPKDSEY